MKTLQVSILLAIFTGPVLAIAEDIKIPIGMQSSHSKHLDVPTTGTDKGDVVSRFGKPIKESTPKGKPPISSWEYAEFTVYFEGSRVIHSVIKPRLESNNKLQESVETARESAANEATSN